MKKGVFFSFNKKRKRSKMVSVFGEESSEEEGCDEEELKKRAVDSAKQGKFKESLTLFDQLIGRGCNKDATVFEMRSQILMEMDDRFEAVQSAHRATELDSDWYIAWLTLARAQLNFGEAELALKSAEMAMKKSPTKEDESVLSFLREVRVIVQRLREKGKDGCRLKVI